MIKYIFSILQSTKPKVPTKSDGKTHAMAEAIVSTQRTSSHLLVVAFDFGTTYSGYAFSFINDPLRIETNLDWNAGSEKLVSLKTPTCVLLSPDRKFHSFGYEAENKYSQLAFDNEHSDWLLFQRFKMLLYEPGKLTRAIEIKDINGNPMPAMTIFAMSIRFLRKHFLDLLERRYTGIRETDIQYVLTVPAIWNDSAKQFMREAAIEAGIDTSRLRLALEPEAASIWCQTLTEDNKRALTKDGTKCMVVDLGGGTVDVSVYSVKPNGTLSELQKASGGPWGGTEVDNNYIAWLSNMFGRKAVDRLKAEDMASFFDLLRELEINKRSVRYDATDPHIFKISATLKEFSDEEEEGRFASRLASQNVVIRRDKMKIDPEVVRQWFDGPINSIIRHMEVILSNPNMENLETIVLVGGFAESMFVQEKIKNDLNNKKFIVPNDTGLVVLKGAVRFGHQPDLISTRIIKCTYGIGVKEDFDPLKHPSSMRSLINGKMQVDGIFMKFVCAGETVKVGHEICLPMVPNSMESTLVHIVSSPDPDPQYTTDHDCTILGKLIVKHPDGDTLDDKAFIVLVTFGDTELKVKALIRKTNKVFDTTIDCLK